MFTLSFLHQRDGQYRIDSQATPTMLNCLMYKLSYYRSAFARSFLFIFRVLFVPAAGNILYISSSFATGLWTRMVKALIG